MTPTTLIYLHGFRSSSQSVKAQQTVAYVHQSAPQVSLLVPDLSDRPRQAMQQISDLLRWKPKENTLAFIGSSLGGFYASCCVETFGGKAALINPAVAPTRDLEAYLGEQTNMHTQAAFEWSRAHLADLTALYPATLADPSRYYLLVETGDDVLDYREACARYAGGKQCVREGGDHSFQAYAEQLPSIIEFLTT
jgi:uncharacterized protein